MCSKKPQVYYTLKKNRDFSLKHVSSAFCSGPELCQLKQQLIDGGFICGIHSLQLKASSQTSGAFSAINGQEVKYRNFYCLLLFETFQMCFDPNTPLQ